MKSKIFNKISDNSSLFLTLVKRHFLVFFKNWVTIIFTLMVPLVILAVYALFLRPLEVDVIKEMIDTTTINIPSNIEFSNKVYALADSWMISGVLAVSCITVSINSCYLYVRDKESGVSRDFISSPISSRLIMLSYFFFNMIVTFVINIFVYIICLIYLLGYGAYMISVLDFFAIIGIILLSCLSASLLTFFICSFIKTESVLSPVVAIVSAAIGFLIGAYLPISMLPKSIAAITNFFPGTYSAGLLRNYFLQTPINQLKEAIFNANLLSDGSISSDALNFVNNLENSFTLDLNFFGQNVPSNVMVFVLFLFSGIFLVLNYLIATKNFFKIKIKKIKRSKKK